MLVPGLGSYMIMKDVFGGVVQDALYIGGVFLMINATNFSTHPEPNMITASYAGLFSVSFIFNIVRSATYDKPIKTASIRNDGFNVAVLPDSRGKLLPYFLYSKAF